MSTDFDIYVEKYSTKHKITTEEAKQHKLVKEVKEYYDKKGLQKS